MLKMVYGHGGVHGEWQMHFWTRGVTTLRFIEVTPHVSLFWISCTNCMIIMHTVIKTENFMYP